MADIWFPTGDISNSFRSNIIDCLFFLRLDFLVEVMSLRIYFFSATWMWCCYWLIYISHLRVGSFMYDMFTLVGGYIFILCSDWLIYVWHIYADWWLHIYSLQWLAHSCMTPLRWLVATYLFSALIGSFMYDIFTLIGAYIFILCSDWLINVWHLYADWWLHIYSLQWLVHYVQQ